MYSLRKCFSIALQDTYLLSGTIRENIVYGKLNATDEEIHRAVSMSNADAFIHCLPKGYDTELAKVGAT